MRDVRNVESCRRHLETNISSVSDGSEAQIEGHKGELKENQKSEGLISDVAKGSSIFFHCEVIERISGMSGEKKKKLLCWRKCP